MGLTGDTGPMGSQGPQGEMGPSGVMGLRGEKVRRMSFIEFQVLKLTSQLLYINNSLANVSFTS